MELKTAIDRFAALSQETRLTVLRALVKAGPSGESAGDIATSLDVPASTLSFHLKELQAAGLVSSERQGRTILYRADYVGLRELIRFLMEDCCQNDPEICLPFALGEVK